MMAWAELLRDAVVGKLDLIDEEERIRPFYRKLSDEDVTRLRATVRRLLQWGRWDAPLNGPDRKRSVGQ